MFGFNIRDSACFLVAVVSMGALHGDGAVVPVRIQRVAQTETDAIGLIASNWGSYESQIDNELLSMKSNNPNAYSQATSILGAPEAPKTFDSQYVDNAMQLFAGLRSSVSNEVAPSTSNDSGAPQDKEFETSSSESKVLDSQSSAEDASETSSGPSNYESSAPPNQLPSLVQTFTIISIFAYYTLF